jgi:hypothetical protein
MKRWALAILVLAALFLLLFLGLNLFDVDTGPGIEVPPPAAASLEPGSGFFLLWGFAEPPGTDPATEAYGRQVRELFALPRRDSHSRSRFGLWLARLNDDYRQYWQGASFYFPQLPGEDVASYFEARRAQVAERQKRFSLLLRRYRGILRAGEMEDFTPLGWVFPSRSHLLAGNVAKLFAASRVLAALDGDWLRAGEELLEAVDAGFRLIASGRTLTVNTLGKSLVELSLRSSASLLNRCECPPEFARLVLERLAARPARDFGTAAVRAFTMAGFDATLERIKKEGIVDPFLLKDHFRDPAALYALERLMAMSGPRFFAAFHALAAFFVQKNESVAMMRAFWDGVGALEEMPPWRWESAPLRLRRSSDVAAGPFWWLRNPLGKMMVNSAVPFNWPILQHYVFRSHELKVRHDLTRLLARARLACRPGAGLDEAALRMLLAAGEEDPFSGAPFRFDREREVLFSIGPDGINDKGRERPEIWRGSDIAVPIKFVIPGSETKQ